MVAKANGKIIGMVSLLYTVSTALGSRVAILEDMVVSAEHRGAGIGSTLLTHAIELAREKGCKRISLMTDQDNETAQHFYQKQGFAKS